jgi:hypothetical protein
MAHCSLVVGYTPLQHRRWRQYRCSDSLQRRTRLGGVMIRDSTGSHRLKNLYQQILRGFWQTLYQHFLMYFGNTGRGSKICCWNHYGISLQITMVPKVFGHDTYSNYLFRNLNFNVKYNGTLIVMYWCIFMIRRFDSKFLLKPPVSAMYLFHHIDPTVRADLTFREFRCLMKSDTG